MQQAIAILGFETQGKGLQDITFDITSWLRQQEIRVGLLTMHCQHTSASLLITENASDAVQRDLLRWFDAAAPDGMGYEHSVEGPDDMPAHIKTALTGNSITIPVADGRMMLGTWQGVFLAEHRAASQTRTIAVHLLGD